MKIAKLAISSTCVSFRIAIDYSISIHFYFRYSSFAFASPWFQMSRFLFCLFTLSPSDTPYLAKFESNCRNIFSPAIFSAPLYSLYLSLGYTFIPRISFLLSRFQVLYSSLAQTSPGLFHFHVPLLPSFALRF